MQTIKTILKFLRTLAIALVVLYGVCMGLLTIPTVQSHLTVLVERELGRLLHTEVGIGHITVGYPNRLILDDVELHDQQGAPLLQAARLSARFEWMPLLREGRISVHTAQLFGLHFNLKRTRPDEPLNMQFLLDAFSSSDTLTESHIDLRINSLLVRRCHFRYDVDSEAQTPGVFTPHHIALANINATIALKAFRHDSINALVKRLDLSEQSGFRLEGAQMHLLANMQSVRLENFDMRLPHSRIRFDSIHLSLPADTLSSTAWRVDGQIRQSYLTLSDIAAFVPALQHFHTPLYMNASVKGNADRLTFPMLQVRSQDEALAMRLDAASIYFPSDMQPDKVRMEASVPMLEVTQEGIPLLWHNLKGNDAPLPDVLHNLGFVHFDGKVNGSTDDLATYGHLATGIGEVMADARFTLATDGLSECKGHIVSDSLDMATLLGNEQQLGIVSFNLAFEGKLPHDASPDIYLKGNIPSLQYAGYTYQNIRLDGWIKQSSFDGWLALEDPNVRLVADGHVSMPDEGIPTFDLTARINHFRPHDLRLTEEREGYEYAAVLKAYITGNTPDNIMGVLSVDSLVAALPLDTFYMPQLAFSATTNDHGGKLITIDSEVIQARIEGDYTYETLPESFRQIVGQYLPSLRAKKQRKDRQVLDNEFTFNIRLADSKFYPYVLGIPLTIYPKVTLDGFISNPQGRVEIAGEVPHLTLGDDVYEIGKIRCFNSPEQMTANFSIAKHMADEARVTLMVDAQAKDDCLNTTIAWGNDSPITYAGSIEAETHFLRKESNPSQLRTEVRMKPSEIIINDTVWHVAASTIRIDSGYVDIHGLGMNHGNQHLLVNGRMGSGANDSLVINLNRIAVEYILDIVQFDAVDFSGKASGKIFLNGALGDMQARTDLRVDDFHFNHGLMGDMKVSARWDNELGVVLDADIREADTLALTHVSGYVSPQQKGLNLMIDTHNTNLAFLNSFIGGIFADVNGRATGPIHLHGLFKELNLEGKALATASLKPRILNTPFRIENDTIILTTDGIYFPDVTAYDPYGNPVHLSGKLPHRHLKNIAYDFNLDFTRACIYNTTDFGEMPFYGEIYATGSAHLYGGGNVLRLNGDIRTEQGTTFVYDMSSPASLTDNRFITFVDRTPRPRHIVVDNLRLFQRTQEEDEKDGLPLQVFIDANIEATTDADVKVIMDARTGDHISANGNGSIQLFFSNENTNLRGEYIIESGLYKMSFENVIRKDFQLQQGSKVNFTGNGGEAELDLKASYTVNSASLSDLIPDATFNQNTVKVNCIINMTGTLDNPIPDFDLELPTVNDEERQLVRSAISTDEQMRMQIVYLLLIGKFYTYDYAAVEGQQSSDAMSSILSSTLSGQLNNMLSQALNMNNWNFSSNFSTGHEGWSDLEVEGILSGRLLNNRLLVNGSFGYRENEMRNSNFIGDWDVQWFPKPAGPFSLKAYSMINDRYFAKQTFSTQGIGIVYKREFDNWREFFRLKKKE